MELRHVHKVEHCVQYKRGERLIDQLPPLCLADTDVSMAA